MSSKIPDNVVNKSLYKKAKEKANETYGKKTSAYKSMYIVSQYKKMGGKYKGKKENKGVDKWNKEQWIQVKPFIKDNKKIPCGFRSSPNQTKACRPNKRVDKSTPITIKELKKLHTNDTLISLANEKIKNMSVRVNWKKGTITKPKKK